MKHSNSIMNGFYDATFISNCVELDDVSNDVEFPAANDLTRRDRNSWNIISPPDGTRCTSISGFKAITHSPLPFIGKRSAMTSPEAGNLCLSTSCRTHERTCSWLHCLGSEHLVYKMWFIGSVDCKQLKKCCSNDISFASESVSFVIMTKIIMLITSYPRRMVKTVGSKKYKHINRWYQARTRLK